MGDSTVAGDRPQEVLDPVRERERIGALDLVRGFAVFGILLVNMQLFFAPLEEQWILDERWVRPIDRVAEFVIELAAQGKFYSLFSLLFGAGLAIQMRRCEARGIAFGPFVRRRMGWLLVIGLAHAFLVWFGDILTLYALIGLTVPLFQRRSPRALWTASLLLLALPIALLGAIALGVEAARTIPQAAAEMQDSVRESRVESLERIEQAVAAYSGSAIGPILRVRAQEVATTYAYAAFWAPNILALFLIGFALGRRSWTSRLEEVAGWARPRLVPLVIFAVAANLVMVVAGRFADPLLPGFAGLLAQFAFTVGAPLLGVCYAAGLVLLSRDAAWQRRLAPLAAVGRLALSNYLLQSVVGTTLANGYGLGLYGRMTPATSIGLALGLFGLQLPLSVAWLRRFRFGPVEWAWRSLTYGAVQPLRRPR